MKSQRFSLISLFPFLVLLTWCQWKPSYSTPDTFPKCLINASMHSHPISKLIYNPNSTLYQDVLHFYIRNARYMIHATPKPLFIIAATHESHIQAAILCSKRYGLQLRARSCGHDLEGVSYVSDVPFVILDMFHLRSIQIDIANETAWIQSGATMGELYYKIAEKSDVHAFPGGVCPSVCAGGYISGGGYGNMMRKYGLSSDNVVNAVIIDVDGRIMNRECMGEDLFWAIRGGGASSFGVILSYKIKLVRVPPIVTVFNVQRTLEEGATSLVHQWQHLAETIDDDMFIRLKFNVEPKEGANRDEEKTIRVAFIGMYLGQAKPLLQLMNTSFSTLRLQRTNCNETSWVQSVLFWSGLPMNDTRRLLNRANGLIFAKTKSDYVKSPISKQGLEAIWKEMIPLNWVGMQWSPYGGRMSEISESETPFPHRKSNLYMIQYFVYWSEPGENETAYHLNLIRKLYSATTTFVSKSPREAFFNYRDFDIGRNLDNFTDYKEARGYGLKYFKRNFDRLVQVKTRVDRCNFFKNGQSIPSLGKCY